ncbi:hypothetical protein KAI04_00080 [Candidatus Pacearchaeota archaeon]|nr:hypothetical protein [Candidatus Pacearchaeota archaeon]
MVIKLDQRYSFSADKFQWILLKDDRPFWFFENLECLLKNYVSLKIKDFNAQDINNLIESINKQQELLHKLLTSLDIGGKLSILASKKHKFGEKKG